MATPSKTLAWDVEWPRRVCAYHGNAPRSFIKERREGGREREGETGKGREGERERQNARARERERGGGEKCPHTFDRAMRY